jgi:hypothetical protein
MSKSILLRRAHVAKALVLLGSALEHLRAEDVVTRMAHKQLLVWATKGCKEEKLLAISSSLLAEIKRAEQALDLWEKTPGSEGKAPIYRLAAISAVACALDFALAGAPDVALTMIDHMSELVTTDDPPMALGELLGSYDFTDDDSSV